MVFHNFVVEHGTVEGKTKLNWVAWVQRSATLLSQSVIFKGTLFDAFFISSLGALRHVSVIISNKLVEEGFRLISRCGL